MVNMGLAFGLERENVCFPRANRWMFYIPGVCGDQTPGVTALPPEKSARPEVSFKEMSVSHLIEDVYYPAKPEWKPFQVTLYNVSNIVNPVFEWIRQIYDPEIGQFYEPLKNNFIKDCILAMYNGCGDLLESWIYEDCWAQNTNFNQLDYGSSSIMMIDITIRYARAYIQKSQNNDLP